jgi:hypothetical protein
MAPAPAGPGRVLGPVSLGSPKPVPGFRAEGPRNRPHRPGPFERIAGFRWDLPCVGAAVFGKGFSLVMPVANIRLF